MPLTTQLPVEPATTDETRKLSYVQAINEGLRQCLEADPDVFLVGEDIGLYGSVFGITRGLFAKFGGERVVDTPISEAALVGLGVGAAATGLRPVVDIMFMDFLPVAMDQVVNQAAKMKYMFGGTVTLPLTIVTMAGGGAAMAAQHSQSLEAWFCHVPGLKVVMPASPYDAKGLMISAVREDNPVLVVCNKVMLGANGPVPEEPYTVPLGKARVVREGSDVTIVALGRMVVEAQKAAAALDDVGVSCEVIDPRTLQPLDVESIIASVQRTNRCLVVHEAVRFGGIGGEIAAQVQELAFDHLDAPVGRVGAPFCPVPYTPSLEKAYLPDAERIRTAALAIMNR